MERAANIQLTSWAKGRAGDRVRVSARIFAAIILVSACASAALASWLPLQMSIATVFLFAGPHNWFEARYFMMRLPARFGRSRNFFTVAFAGIGLLTVADAAWSHAVGIVCLFGFLVAGFFAALPVGSRL